MLKIKLIEGSCKRHDSRNRHKISNKSVSIKAEMIIYIKKQVILEPFSPVLLLVFAIEKFIACFFSIFFLL